MLDAYRNALRTALAGNRAPLSLGNHFNTWSGGIYRDALTEFVRESCTRPGVYCVSYRRLADWLDAQSRRCCAGCGTCPPAADPAGGAGWRGRPAGPAGGAGPRGRPVAS